MTMKKADEARLNQAIRSAVRGMKPPEKLTVSQWADKKRRLSAESSAETGPWRTSRTPYLKDILDSFTDPKVKNIVVVASSQVGKSETINNMIGYIIDQDPSSILFIQPTTIDAKEYSKLRIAPMIRDCPTLKKKVADPKSRDSGNTILQKTYPGGILTMCGSTEAHALASKPIRYVFGDERDRWAVSAGNEGDPWELAKARQTTFYNSKSVQVSTPTIKGASAIESAYSDGTCERWCTKCPHCGEYHEITFDNIRFEYEEIKSGKEISYKVTSLFYACPYCGAASSEATMKRQPSKWIADNPEAYELHRTRSFWLTSWVSPWAAWADTIVMFLKARGDTKKMQVVYNTRFGMLWEDRGDIEDEDSVMSRREDYRAELPDGVLCLTCGVDTQDDRFEYEVVGHGHFGETWGIRKGVILARPDSDEAWAALEEVVKHIYKFESGVGLPVSLTFIDEGGHFTQDVRMRCRERTALKMFPVKGRGGSGVPYTSPPKQQKIVVHGKAIGKCYVFEIGVDSGKQIIMDNLRVKSPGPKYCHFPRNDEYGGRFFKSLLSERLVYKEGKKNPWQWEKIPGHERNEALDCRNYALAACKSLNPNFDDLERRICSLLGKTNKAVATPKKKAKTTKKMKSNNFDEW
ncbi:MAG: phage terminase large subunit family protein [Acutalibacteraceae bacterium]